MRKIRINLLCFAGILVLLFNAAMANTAKKTLTAFCGAASKPPLEEAAQRFKEKTGIRVDLQFGGSGTVLSQMKLSRRGDLYIPGSPDYMILAIRQGVVNSQSIKILAYLVMAIDVQRGNPKNIKNLSDLAEPGIRVGIGNPEAVCVGLYAVELLEKNNLLQQVRANIVTHAPSCAAVASLLVMKKVDAVIGWKDFSKWNPEQIETVLLRPREIPRLAYIPAAVSTYSRDPESARAFIDFLVSPEGQAFFVKWGYITAEKEAQVFAPQAVIGGEYVLPRDYQPLVQ